ncbi:unnamed protein product [Taenia asiatica]|uniref:Uncharacterized protein n=1 Tax=Taenia asiatica TaxID=60517 RepID=A0A3P6P9A0_TAEAS|nr:unnamed protein product [Taenia asiatica]
MIRQAREDERDFIGWQRSRRTRIDGLARGIRGEISLRGTKRHSLPLRHYQQRVFRTLHNRKHKASSKVERRKMGGYAIMNDDDSSHAHKYVWMMIFTGYHRVQKRIKKRG